MAAQPRSGCPINRATEVPGDPWSMLVLRDVIFGNRRHFRELLRGSIEGIASNILSSRVKRLVGAGLLTKEAVRRGQRAASSLSEAGIQTLPVMVAHGNRSLAHRDGGTELRVRAELLRDHPELAERLQDELREIHLGIPRPHPNRPRPARSCRRPTSRPSLPAPAAGGNKSLHQQIVTGANVA